MEIGTSGAVYLVKQDFFLETTHQHLHTPKKINKVPENILLYITGNLPCSGQIFF